MKRFAVILLGVSLAGSTCWLGGCAAVAYIVAQFSPPPKVKAQYTLPPAKRVLVWVDSDEPLPYEPLRGDLIRNLNAQLEHHKLAKSTVDWDRAIELVAGSDRRVGPMGAARQLDADLVLSVRIREFKLRDEFSNPVYTARLTADVTVEDVQQGRLWPQSSEAGHAVGPIDLPPTDDPSRTVGTELSRLLALQMSDRIAKLFYEHTGSTRPQ